MQRAHTTGSGTHLVYGNIHQYQMQRAHTTGSGTHLVYGTVSVSLSLVEAALSHAAQ